jgi:transposase
MVKALSVDLRTRVLAAVSAGASHRVAAARFGVSAASVSRWRALDREKGDVRPGALGGDRRSGRIEAQATLILALLAETPDITVEELRAALGERGHAFGYGTLQRFFARHRITRKKRPRTPASRIVPTS